MHAFAQPTLSSLTPAQVCLPGSSQPSNQAGSPPLRRALQVVAEVVARSSALLHDGRVLGILGGACARVAEPELAQLIVATRMLCERWGACLARGLGGDAARGGMPRRERVLLAQESVAHNSHISRSLAALLARRRPLKTPGSAHAGRVTPVPLCCKWLKPQQRARQ